MLQSCLTIIILSSVFTIKVSLTKLFTVDGYIGCFTDDRNEIKLTSEQITAERSFTLQQCNTYCFNKGYKVAAAKNGSQCLCGDIDEGNLPEPNDKRLCNVPCLSDLSTRCGGVNAYTVYSTGITENDIGDLSKLEIGCLRDESETRLIKEHKTDLLRTNSPARCIAYCRRLGYPHAGVQYGIECYCGMASRTGPTESGCDLPCSGDPLQYCGGHWRINVYSTGVFNNTMDVTLSGCFLYDESVAITTKTIESMTPNKCIAHCYYQGLYYAHIYNGNECLCGRRITPFKFRMTMSKCDMTCKGDAKEVCGGEMYMVSYATGVVGDPILGRFESCYHDDNKDLLSGPKFNLGNENSIHYCIARCIEVGYAFAGLRNIYECQCSQESPKRSLLKMVPNDLCNSPCPKIELQQCGAENFLALHRTGIIPYNERASGAVLPGYLGCYRDNRNEVRLTGHQATARTMTVVMCNALCFTMAFKHAASKDGKECYCGDIDGVIPKPDDDSLCNVQCISDVSVKCGGKNAYSLYSTGIKEDDIDLEDLEIGCISDGDDTRLIPEHKIDLVLTNTPKRCTAYCRALGYTHAGVQYSQECYCGSARRLDSVVDGCDKPCVGDESLYCGGDWKANVYTTGITRPPPGVAPRGCYRHNQTLISTRKKIANINDNKCASFCYSRKMAMAYILEGEQCLCGKSLPPPSFKAPPKKCDIKCEDSNSKCGGVGVMSAYTTGLIGDPSIGKLIGCFRDENNDLLSGPKLNLGALNSIHECIAKCIELGYAYAGLRNTFECQCSQAAPKRTPVKIVPDYECASPCPQFQLQTCGAPVFTAIHRTGVTASGPDCASTISKANGKSVCGGQVLFSEEFDTLDSDVWENSVKISGEDSEFVIYTKKKKNVDVKNGKLVIQPTLLPEKFVKYGFLKLKGCTGVESTQECTSSAEAHQILPPVESGQICTRRSFNFRYGVITVRVKLPKGDWVIPQIWLKPVKDLYGSGYRSGKIILVTARGNSELQGPEGTEIGAKMIESGFQVSSVYPYNNVESRTVDILSSDPWYSAYHNYSLTWTDDTMLFYIDGNVVSGLKTLFRYSDKSLLDEMGMPKDTYWKNGTIMAPFDQDFYLCLGLSVGGVRSFPDDSLSNGAVKPWKNYEMKGRLNFWLNRNYWEPTWSEDTKLEVDSIKVTAY